MLILRDINHMQNMVLVSTDGTLICHEILYEQEQMTHTSKNCKFNSLLFLTTPKSD